MTPLKIFSLLFLFISPFLGAAAPSLVKDYDVQIEKRHQGSFIPLADGHVLAIDMNRIDGVTVPSVVRLDAAGKVVAGFPGFERFHSQPPSALSVTGGKTLVRQVGSTTGPRLSMWLADGTPDPSFTSPFDENAYILGIAPAEGGKFFVWGGLPIGGKSFNLVKILPDGSLDGIFAKDISGEVRSIVRDGDSHFLIAGGQLTVGFSERFPLIRITLNGSLDIPFDRALKPNSSVNAILIDDKDFIYIAGQFYAFGSKTQERVARLFNSGVLDASFVSSQTFISPDFNDLDQPDQRDPVETTFSGPSSIMAYSKEPGFFYVVGDLTLGNRETSVVSFDPESGLKANFGAARANAPALGVARFGNLIAVAGGFTRWGEARRNGLVFLNGESAVAILTQPRITSATASANHTLIRWEIAGEAVSYRIESRNAVGEDWQIDASTSVFRVDSSRPDVRSSVQTSADLLRWTAADEPSTNLAVPSPQSVSHDVRSAPKLHYRIHCRLR